MVREDHQHTLVSTLGICPNHLLTTSGAQDKQCNGVFVECE